MNSKEKFKIVLQLLIDESRLEELSVKHNISSQTLVEWKNYFLKNAYKTFLDESESEDRFNMLIDSMPVTVSHIASDMTYINVNKKLAEFVGMPKEEFIGKKVGFTEKNSDFCKLINKIFESEDDFITNESVINIESGKFYYLMIGNKFCDGNELIIIGIDITNLKEQEKLLVSKARFIAMGEMIGNIAHQWRQPLSTISTIVANIQVKRSLGELDIEDIEKPLAEINDQAQFLSSTINDFRDFFKQDKERKSVNPAGIIAKAVSMTEHSLGSNGIALVQEYSFSKPFFTYPNELVQVLLNLIKNAQDVLLEKNIVSPRIEIRGYEKGDELIFEISDNAGGVPEEIKDKIFEPYFTTKDEESGTGLGLYMSKIIVEKHCNGILKVENTDIGAKFILLLKYRAR